MRWGASNIKIDRLVWSQKMVIYLWCRRFVSTVVVCFPWNGADKSSVNRANHSFGLNDILAQPFCGGSAVSHHKGWSTETIHVNSALHEGCRGGWYFVQVDGSRFKLPLMGGKWMSGYVVKMWQVQKYSKSEKVLCNFSCLHCAIETTWRDIKWQG